MRLPQWVRPTVTILGLAFVLAGVTGVAIGTWAAAWLRESLPAVRAEPRVVGGAASAIGALLALVGGGHLIVAVRLDRPAGALRAPAVVGALTLAFVALVGLATVAVTLAREASAAALWLTVPAFVGGAILYLRLGWLVLRALRR